MKPEFRKRVKPSQKILREASIGITLATPGILSFQEKVAKNPSEFLEPIQRSPKQKSSPWEPPSLQEDRKKSQETLLENICTRIQELSHGTIDKNSLEEGIQTRCASRALSILYSTVYQEEEGKKRLEIIESAGEKFQKEEGGTGVRAGGICSAFLRQNGLSKKISHRDMAVELKAAFHENFQKTRGALEAEGYEINDAYLKRMLAAELFRKIGGRVNKPFLISNAKDAARRFVQKTEPERENLRSIYQTLLLTEAASEFVKNQINPEIKEHLLENPLQPVFERNQHGRKLIHPSTGKPILNPNLPDHWRKHEVNSTIEEKFQALEESPEKEEIGILLDTLRIPKKLNIPLQVAQEQITGKFPALPQILEQARETEKLRLAYDISRSSYSVAYRLGLIISAAGIMDLSSHSAKILENIQRKVENLSEKSTQIPKYWNELGGDTPDKTWEEIDIAFQEAKQILTKTPTPEIPKIHEPVFETPSR